MPCPGFFNLKRKNLKEDHMEGWAKIKPAALYAGISDRTLRVWLKKGLKHSRMNQNNVLIKYDNIDEFIKSFEVSESETKKLDRIVNETLRELRLTK